MKKGNFLLNVFRLHDTIDGVSVRSFEDFLVEKRSPLKTYVLSPAFPFKARLFVSEKETNEPPWAGYLRGGFMDLPNLINVITNRALLIIAVKFGRQNIHFGISFGFGRYLLKPSSYIRNYGLKVALNAIYHGISKKTGVDTDLIQSLDIKTVAANTIHTRRQSNRRTALEMFGVDVQRDILRFISGRPSAEDDWGTRISGSDALTIGCPVDFNHLGERCRLIETYYRRKDYKEYAAWIDHLKPVTDPLLKQELESELLAMLIKPVTETGNLELAPPEIVDWDRIKCFRFSFAPERTYGELELESFLAALEEKGKRPELTIKQLRSSYRIEALDNNDQPVGEWSALQCLSGEFSYKGQTYIIEANDFSAVDEQYRKDVDRYIGSLQEYQGKFPDCKATWDEDDFNVNSGKLPNYLLLHKHNVSMSDKTTPIEVCDLLSDDHCFIHVKPKFSSSTLSHLFSQGSISGELFCTSPEFRKETLKAISSAVHKKAKKPTATRLLESFATFKAESINPREYKIVYAIIGNWKGKLLEERLPFFSKLNLRRSAQDLRALGFDVMCRRIQQH